MLENHLKSIQSVLILQQNSEKKMNLILLTFIAFSSAINLAICREYKQAGVNQMGNQFGTNQMAGSTYTQTSTYQQAHNGQQTSFVQETVEQQPSGKTVMTKTWSPSVMNQNQPIVNQNQPVMNQNKPVMSPPTAYSNYGSTFKNGYGRKKRGDDEKYSTASDDTTSKP